MQLNEDLAIVHAYLCADGYVVKNPKTQKIKYYRIGLRNTNYVLLEDFQKRFEKVFNIKPHLRIGERCEKGSKEIYEKLTKKFGSFYSYKWRMPKLTKKLSRNWLKTFFDCEGWVTCKTHQNRHIGLDSVNKKGVDQIIKYLNLLGIKVIKKEIKKRNIYRINIYGRDNLKLFQKEINFLHPEKKEKLEFALNDYIVYKWEFPRKKEERKKLLKEKLKEKLKIKNPNHFRMVSKEYENLKNVQLLLKEFYNIDCKIYKCVNGLGTTFYELNISRKGEVQKLIKFKLVSIVNK